MLAPPSVVYGSRTLLVGSLFSDSRLASAFVSRSPPSPCEEAKNFRASARQKRPMSEGYRAGVAWSLANAFPVSECGSFAGLLQAIDNAER